MSQQFSGHLCRPARLCVPASAAGPRQSASRGDGALFRAGDRLSRTAEEGRERLRRRSRPTIPSGSRRTSPSLADGIRAARADANPATCSAVQRNNSGRSSGRTPRIARSATPLRRCGRCPSKTRAAGQRRLSGDRGAGDGAAADPEPPAALPDGLEYRFMGARSDPARHQSQPDRRRAARSGADGGTIDHAAPARQRRLVAVRRVAISARASGARAGARRRASPTARTR